MQVTTNDKLIGRRRKLGTYASLGALGVLVAGMIASFQQQFVWVSLVAIVAGFLLAQYGNYNLRRWGRNPRPDQVIESALKGFDDRYHFYAWSLPVPYVLLTPQGIYSFTVRDQTGEITVNGSQWRSKFSLSRVLLAFAQEGLGNPTNEAVDNAERLSKWIAARQPEVTAKVQPVIIFIDPRARLTINEPTVPVQEPKGLKKWLRGAGKGDNLKSEHLRVLEALFDGKPEGSSES